MKGIFIRKNGIAICVAIGENKDMGITSRKLFIKMNFEDMEFDDLCEVVQSIYGSASAKNIEIISEGPY